MPESPDDWRDALGELAGIVPDWPAPPWVRALTTTRLGGASEAPFASFNLATHVGDDPERVRHNRRLLRERLALPAEPAWLEQVHGVAVADLDAGPPQAPADAAITRAPGQVCAVLTADCLPVLLCDPASQAVAAVHAGWRGLLAGVIDAAVVRLALPPERLLAWLGPAIGPAAFEVGAEVRAGYLDWDAASARAFQPTRPGHWQADLYQLARLRLARLGVRQVHGGGACTASDARRFYSYRRDGRTGRMATLIWVAR